jgi:hypothetical protein
VGRPRFLSLQPNKIKNCFIFIFFVLIGSSRGVGVLQPQLGSADRLRSELQFFFSFFLARARASAALVTVYFYFYFYKKIKKIKTSYQLQPISCNWHRPGWLAAAMMIFFILFFVFFLFLIFGFILANQLRS